MITKTEHTNVGKLNKRVTFSFWGTTSDGMGGLKPDANDTDVITTWASVEPVSGDQRFVQGALESNITHKIEVRYRDDLSSQGYSRDKYDNILKATYDSRTFNIQYVLNRGEDNTFITMLAVEEDAT